MSPRIELGKVPRFSASWLNLATREDFFKALIADRRSYDDVVRFLVTIIKFQMPFIMQFVMTKCHRKGQVEELSSEIQSQFERITATMVKLRDKKPVILASYHNQFMDVIPPEWLQLRNIVLSAVPEWEVYQNPDFQEENFSIR